jgi:hypothetical protein
LKKLFLSVALALSLILSSQSVAYAFQQRAPIQANANTEESILGFAASDGSALTPTGVFNAMIALKDQDGYKEGTPWTDDEPYSDSTGYYRWKGGPLDGHNIVAVGCVAFAFILSDAAFDSLPARMYANGEFEYEDIKVGDILRVNNDAHTVIALEVNEAGLVLAEGNISTGDHKGKIHWGRKISKEEVMRSASHYITRYPENYISPDDPEANVIVASETLEGGLAWNLTKAGKMTISGKGAMPDFSSTGDQPWNSYSSQIRNVVIGDGVTGIGSCAFWKCEVLSVEIPTSVTSIGNSAFRESSVLSVNIPANVKMIGDSAFRGCKSLSSVTFSEGLETISQNAFNACENLTVIDLPASIGEVGAGAFFQCGKLTSVTFAPGSKQVKMGDNLFGNCYYLMKVTLPKSVDRISEGMFINCQMLAGVEIPQGAESIDPSAFASCYRFTTVIIPNSVTSIGMSAFSACSLSDIYFTGTEAQWNSISKSAETIAAMSKATIHYEYKPSNPDDGDNDNNSGDGDNSGDGNTPGGDNSGDGNTPGGDNSGDGNTPGGDNSGDGNTPGGDNSGDGNTPGGDNSGDGNTPGGDNSGDGNTPGGGNSGDGNTPGGGNNSTEGDASGSGGNSENSENQTAEQPALGKEKTFVIDQVTYKVTVVGEEVELITSASKVKNVTIDTVTGIDGITYKVTSIGSKAMQNNKNMTGLAIGANVKTIGANAFSGCSKLKKVSIGKNITVIEAGAFKGCAALKKITLPDSVKTIGANAFSGCKKLTAATIGKTSKSKLATIGKRAFSGCKKLSKVTIKSTKLNFVGKQAFKGSKSGLTVKVPSKQFNKYKNYFKNAGLKVRQVKK